MVRSYNVVGAMPSDQLLGFEAWCAIAAGARAMPDGARGDYVAAQADPFVPLGSALALTWTAEQGRRSSPAHSLGDGSAHGLPSSLPFDPGDVFRWLARPEATGITRLSLVLCPPEPAMVTPDTVVTVVFQSPYTSQLRTPAAPAQPAAPAVMTPPPADSRGAVELARAQMRIEILENQVSDLRARVQDAEARAREAEREARDARAAQAAAKHPDTASELLKMMFVAQQQRDPAADFAKMISLVRELTPAAAGGDPDVAIVGEITRGISSVVHEARAAAGADVPPVIGQVMSGLAQRGVEPSHVERVMGDAGAMDALAAFIRAPKLVKGAK